MVIVRDDWGGRIEMIASRRLEGRIESAADERGGVIAPNGAAGKGEMADSLALRRIICLVTNSPSNVERLSSWIRIADTPGCLRVGIHQLGRLIFASYTTVPVEEILVMSTLIQPEDVVRRTLEWIVANGVREFRAEMDFAPSLPDYGADMQIWSACGHQFMVVKDFAGYYIYAWPDSRLAVAECEDGKNACLPEVSRSPSCRDGKRR